MKKSLLSMMGIAVTALAFGQNITAEKKSPVLLPQDVVGLTEASSVTSLNTRSAASSVNALGTVWFAETFGAGLAGDPGNGTWSNYGEVGGSADPDAVWEYRGVSTTPNNTVGSRGAYGTNSGTISSPTAANGFFIFDSDYLDNDGVEGNFGNGIAATPHVSYLESSTFSTVGGNDLMVSVNAYFRRFAGNAYLLLSIDGGATWGDSVTIMDTETGVNEPSERDNQIYESVSFIDNQANVKIAFFFDGATADASANGLGYYFAMVDDVVIMERPDNDLVINTSYLRTGSDTGINNYYSSIPNVFAATESIEFSATVSNNGGVDQPNSKLTTTVIKPSGTSTLVSSSSNLVVGASDSLVAIGDFEFDAGVGTYAWVKEVSSDSTDDIAFNNVLDTVFTEVTDTIYARDRAASGNRFYGAGNTYEIGNVFEIKSKVKATSISVGVGTGSLDEELISIYIYDFDAQGNPNVNSPLAQKEYITLNASTIGTLVTYAIPATILDAGSYLVSYKTYSADVNFAVSDFTADPGQTLVDVNGDNDWGYTTGTPPIRLNISECLITAVAEQDSSAPGATVVVSDGTAPYTYLWSNGETTASATNLPWDAIATVTVTDDNGCETTASADIINGVDELGIKGNISLYPNPNNGNFQLALDGVEAGAYTLNVKNVLGQSMLVKNISIAQSHTETVEVSNLSKGVYFVEIVNNAGNRTVVNFIVE